jgi:hypothetical protein
MPIVCVKYFVLGGLVWYDTAWHIIPKYFWRHIVLIIVTE